jgi:Flavin containing amine oxidoreductase
LNSSVYVTIVEASDHLGGRIRGYKYQGIEIDVGAEFIHGPGTALTDLVEDLYGVSSPTAEKGQSSHKFDKNQDFSDLYEPIFTVSHADGGPDPEPTVHGKVGMYYIDGSLRPYDDPYAIELRTALDNIFYPNQSIAEDDICDEIYNGLEPFSDLPSIGDALDKADLSPSARQLAISSYGNTAANTDLYSLSLPIMQQFESYWCKCTISGDYRFSSHSGITMSSVLEGLLTKIRQQASRCELRCQWKAQSIRQHINDSTIIHAAGIRPVKVTSDTNDMLHADAVVVTISPPLLQELDMELSDKKKQALSLVGFSRVVKVILIFSATEPPWPRNLNGIICADGLPIPEIWFSEKSVGSVSSASDQTRLEPDLTNGINSVFHIAVGYLTSRMADNFISSLQSQSCSFNNQLNGDKIVGESFSLEKGNSPQSSAARIFVHQLSKVFNLPEETLRASCKDCILHDWKIDEPFVRGGYMYGKSGMTVQHLFDLAEPQDKIFFAGEATNTNACCTVQAAMETGLRASKEVSEHLLSIERAAFNRT